MTSPLDVIKKVDDNKSENVKLLAFGFTASPDIENRVFKDTVLNPGEGVFGQIKGFLSLLAGTNKPAESAQLLGKMLDALLTQFGGIVGESSKNVKWQDLVTLSALIFNASEKVGKRRFFEASATALAAALMALLVNTGVYKKVTGNNSVSFTTELDKQNAIGDGSLYRLYTYLRVFALRAAIVGLATETVATSQKFSRFLTLQKKGLDTTGRPIPEDVTALYAESKLKRKILERLARVMGVSVGDTSLPGMVFGREHPFRDLVTSSRPKLMVATNPADFFAPLVLRPIDSAMGKVLRETRWKGISLYAMATKPALASLRLDGISVTDNETGYRFYFEGKKLHYEKCGYNGGVFIPINA